VLVEQLAVLIMDVDPQMVELEKLEQVGVNGDLLVEILQIAVMAVQLEKQFSVLITL
jgi:hypothetical protein